MEMIRGNGRMSPRRRRLWEADMMTDHDAKRILHLSRLLHQRRAVPPPPPPAASEAGGGGGRGGSRTSGGPRSSGGVGKAAEAKSKSKDKGDVGKRWK
mmetsp:Transcript_34567/g.78165  ORF Transcript_34567/g.78165 Transcript_34567/m.78165 type:complete len:98 (-) Transcript_34567:152-445(-)